MTTRRNITGIPDSLRAFLEEDFASEQDSLLRMWELCDDIYPKVEIDENQKAVIRQAILLAASSAPGRPTREPLRLFRLKQYAVAATVLILVSLGFLLSPDVRTLDSPLGSVSPAHFELDDGTTVLLAAGSRLSYTTDFGTPIRRVALKGEAFFDVATSEAPFVVDTYNARTRVHGTRFSVRAWPRELEAQTEVKVEEGQVSVTSRSREWTVSLVAGQETAVTTSALQTAETGSIDISQAFSWTEGGYEYRNEPVGNVLSDLERRFDIKIEAPKKLQLRPISIFNQSSGTLEEILGDISETIGVNYRRIAGGYELYTS